MNTEGQARTAPSELGYALRALPTFFRIGMQQAIAYRAETLIWILSTTMPFVMLLLWETVAADGPIGRMGQTQFRVYFLASYCVRQVCGSWVSWQINMEMRDGTFGLRLLRPANPILMLGVEQVASTLFRCLGSLPPALLGYVLVAVSGHVHMDGVSLVLLALSLLGGWLLSFSVNLLVGFAAFYTEQSSKLMDLWVALFFAFSGYLIPTELFPEGIRNVVRFLPFRFQLGLPVEIMSGLVSNADALPQLLVQWSYVAFFALMAHVLYRRGVARFGAVGG